MCSLWDALRYDADSVPPLLTHLLARRITVTPDRWQSCRDRCTGTGMERSSDLGSSPKRLGSTYAKPHRLASRLRVDSALSTTVVPTPALR
jgi:hypothetical protein